MVHCVLFLGSYCICDIQNITVPNLFASCVSKKAKYEFVNEVVQMEEVQSEEELGRFKNESLGMAVLHLSHQAMQTGCSLQDVAEKIR